MSIKFKILHKISQKANWQEGLIIKGKKIIPSNDKLAFIKYIADNAFNENTLNVDAIYFNDISPIIYIKELSAVNTNEIIQFQNKFWNESRTPTSLIITPTKIYLLNNNCTPAQSETEFKNILLNEFNTDEEALNNLCEILHQSNIDTDNIFIGTNKIDTTPTQRVDKKLIEQLHNIREHLFNNKEYKLSIGTIHNLLGRSLFTFYLEHRGIINEKQIGEITNFQKSFANLLIENPKETYRLFQFLKEKFNGDLFPVNQEEEIATKKFPSILALVSDCFTGMLQINSKGTGNQRALFPLFNFKYIPIELISAIYEEFMSNEEVKDGVLELTQKQKDGAFYTPQSLVEFTYNEVLPMPTTYDFSHTIKILDPTCGSGIFLVEGFKRLIERWKYSYPERNITQTVLKDILYNNIFGIEKNPEAVKVTAFSLYLTFLNYMNPRKVLDEVKFNNLILWTDEDEVKHRIENNITFGKNILQASTFIRESAEFKVNPIKEVTAFFNTPFNIIVGNPPWKRNNVKDEIKNWAKENNWSVSKDIIKAFIAYVPSINPKAKTALITSAKSLLFNTENTDIKFRQKLFTDYKVNTIVNFSIVRNVLFENAKQAGALIIYENRIESELDTNETILYCVPQKTEIIKSRKAIVIDETEIKFLPLYELLNPQSKLFKIAMYGGLRDLKLINKLISFGIINDLPITQGMGIKKDKNSKRKDNTKLLKHKVIKAEDIQQYFFKPSNLKLEEFQDYEVYRTGNNILYNFPYIIFKEGTKEGQICSSIILEKAVVIGASKVIKMKEENLNFSKASVCCLNSKLSTYFLLCICSSWGVSKGGQIQNNEVGLMPLLANHFSQETITTLANYLDQIIKIKKEEWNNEEKENLAIAPIKTQIDELIYKELKITKYEKALIDNVINYSNVIKANYKAIKATAKIDSNFIKEYATVYADIVNKYFKHSQLKIKIETFNNSLNSPLSIIKCSINKRETEIVKENNADIAPILEEVNKFTYNQYTSSIYFRKTIEYQIDKNSFYLIKPNQRKFWNKAQALNDADTLIVKLLNQYNN